MSIDVSRYAPYFDIPPSEINQFVQFTLLDPIPYPAVEFVPGYEPTKKDLEESDILNYLPPYFIKKYLDGSARSYWFISHYSPTMLQIIPGQGPFVLREIFRDEEDFIVHRNYLATVLVNDFHDVYPWQTNVYGEVYREGFIWLYMPVNALPRHEFPPARLPPEPPKPRHIPQELQNRYIRVFNKYRWFSYWQLVVPFSLEITRENEDLVRDLALDLFHYLTDTIIHGKDFWPDKIPEEYKGYYDRFNRNMNKILRQQKKRDIIVLGIGNFPLIWNCQSFQIYIARLRTNFPNIIPIQKEFNRRQKIHEQTIQNNPEIL